MAQGSAISDDFCERLLIINTIRIISGTQNHLAHALAIVVVHSRDKYAWEMDIHGYF